MSSNQPDLCSPVRSGIKVPSGHILVHEKWRGTDLGVQIVKQAKGIFSGGLGFVDFYLSDYCPAIYITEADFFSSSSYKTKIVKLKSLCQGRGVILVIRNGRTIDNFNELQEFALLKLDLFVFPVGCQMEIPAVLLRLASTHGKSPGNFKRKFRPCSSMASQQIALLALIPGVGNEKANKLLQHFGNIATISQASIDALASVVGTARAGYIYNFFNSGISKK
ncbi:Fanconi anemia core complex-associated protein 24 [Anabrus simplex]|uniref:Fanconi anemia core complex-associated protein 24 n=1 Tax=Anabrus simplex TaxID=316456 RepID=UPI0035A2C039